MLDKIDYEILKTVSDLHSVPQGAFNIRKNGQLEERNSTKNILIEPNEKGNGINIKIKSGTKNESVHIPVILSKAGFTDVVYNDFYVGEGADVTIVAGCGIHADGKQKVEHDGIHRFFVGKNAKVKYVERHVALGKGISKVLNPVTEITLEDGAEFFMETAQLEGVTYADRKTFATLKNNTKLNITEKVLTEGSSFAKTNFVANLEGENSSTHIVSRAVSKDNSVQEFNSVLNGKNKCFGHTECDAIIVGNGKCFAKPEVNALHPESSLIHEAAIGKIAGEQILKLLTLGLTEEEAQEKILKGFLQ